MEPEIKDWLLKLSSRPIRKDWIDSEDYELGYEEGQTILADRILANLSRIEREKVH